MQQQLLQYYTDRCFHTVKMSERKPCSVCSVSLARHLTRGICGLKLGLRISDCLCARLRGGLVEVRICNHSWCDRLYGLNRGQAMRSFDKFSTNLKGGDMCDTSLGPLLQPRCRNGKGLPHGAVDFPERCCKGGIFYLEVFRDQN